MWDAFRGPKGPLFHEAAYGGFSSAKQRKLRALSRKPKAESRKPKAESRKPKAESRKPYAFTASRRPCIISTTASYIRLRASCRSYARVM